MLSTDELYRIADENGITIVSGDLPLCGSCSFPLNDEQCVVGIDKTRIVSSADEKTKIAHEIGHCMKYAFYNRYSRFDIVSRHEYRADKWAIENVIPKDEMISAMKSGLVETWQLAEFFDVSENLVKRAMWIYFDKEIA